VRSFVLAPPEPTPAAGPRKAVVLRAGPAPKKGRVDAALGIFGALLLLSTVLMAFAIPHKDVLPQQFKVTYTDGGQDFPTVDFPFKTDAASQNHDFAFDVPDDDVYQVTVRYFFVDDMAASAPDQFSLQVYDPQGNAVGPATLAVNAEGVADNSLQLAAPTDYKAVPFSSQFSVTVGAKPSDDIVETADQHLTEAQLESQLEQKAHIVSKGTWKVRVTLVSAGGCTTPPEPSSDPEPAERFAVCRKEAQSTAPGAGPGKEDAGNKFAVESFKYTTFSPFAERVG
jgi:hypothetical protein